MDPREAPAYPPIEAARYLWIPVSTVRYWAAGRGGIEPMIEPAQALPLVLSFVNLVELHVLGAIRRKHGMSVPNVRAALDFVERRMAVRRPLATEKFRTDGVSLFVERFGQLGNATKGGQTEMRELLQAALVRIEWDEAGLPSKLFPYTRTTDPDRVNVIVIDPAISGGRAVLHGSRIAVDVLAERYMSGDSIDELATDYGRDRAEIEEAIRYEFLSAA